MKFLFNACWFALLFIHFGTWEPRGVNIVQTMLNGMDIFLALAVPIGLSKSIVSYVKEKHITLRGSLYAFGFLLIFTLSQISHSRVEGMTADALVMAQEPPMGEKIAKLLHTAIVDSQADQRTKAAALLYVVSGATTMYKSEDNQYKVFTPSQEERDERIKWTNSNAQVEAMKQQLRDQAKAIRHRSIFHVSSFFVVFSMAFLFEIRRARKPECVKLP